MNPIKQPPTTATEAETDAKDGVDAAKEAAANLNRSGQPGDDGAAERIAAAKEADEAEAEEVSGELVAPDDPRAAAELDSMIAQLVGKGPSAQEILQAILGAEELAEASPEASQAGIAARILGAESAAEVLDLGEPTKAADLEQVALNVTGVRWMKSTYDEGPGVYAVMDATRVDDGEPIKITSGGKNVMLQLLKLQVAGALPQTVKITKSTRPTQAGYYPYWLSPA